MRFEVLFTNNEWVVFEAHVEVARYERQRDALEHARSRLALCEAGVASLGLTFNAHQPGRSGTAVLAHIDA